MHKYLVLRGVPKLIRRVMENLQDIYYPYINKDTKEQVAVLQLMPREVKTIELAFPCTAKKQIKEDVNRVITKVCEGQRGGIAIHWGPWKKDKFKDGLELV